MSDKYRLVSAVAGEKSDYFSSKKIVYIGNKVHEKYKKNKSIYGSFPRQYFSKVVPNL
jgi:hypothetical protein